MTSAQNILINLKNGKSAKFPFDDPNYIPRVEHRVSIRKREMKDGSIKEIGREKIIHNIPLSTLDRKTLEDMGRLPHQTIPGVPNPNHMSSRKNPRIVNNSPKFKTRRSRHNPDKVSIVQVRGIPIKRLSKDAVKLIREGDAKAIRTDKGTISKRYIVTRLKGTKKDSGNTYHGMNQKKKNKKK